MILIALAGVGAGAINAIVGFGHPDHLPDSGHAGLSAGDVDDVERRRPGSGKRVGNLGIPARTARPVEPAGVADACILHRCGAGRVAAAAPAGEGVPAGRAGAADRRAGSGGGGSADSGVGAAPRRGGGPLGRARVVAADGGAGVCRRSRSACTAATSLPRRGSC